LLIAMSDHPPTPPPEDPNATLVEPDSSALETLLESTSMIAGALADNSATHLSVLAPEVEIAGFRLLAPLKVASTEADIWKVRRERDGAECILKLYRYGVVPRQDVLDAVKALRKDEVVAILQTGDFHGRRFEVQEFLPLGSLADQMKAKTIGPRSARAILEQLANAISHLHNVNVLHRDIKPSNLLVRGLEPLDLVLTDFGISSVADLSLHLTNVNRTAAYAAPEALTGVVAKASDWWSAGVILLEVLGGRHPFSGLNEQAINFQLVSKGIPVPADLDARWRLLLRGLLTRDYRHRWGIDEIRTWQAGGTGLKVHVTSDGLGEAVATVDASARARHKPYRFTNRHFETPAELALVLAENWPEAVKHFGRGLITDWIKSQIYDQEMASRLLDVSQDENLDADQKLTAALMILNPEIPIIYRGEIITPEWFPLHSTEGLKLLRSGLPRWAEALRQDTSLRDLRRRRREAFQKIDALDIPIDLGVANMLLLSDPAKVIDTALRQRSQWVASTDSRIAAILDKGEISFAEAVILLACDRTMLLTAEQREIQQAEVFRQELAARLCAHQIVYDAASLDACIHTKDHALLKDTESLRSQYLKSTRPLLERLLQKSSLSRGEMIILLCADRAQFLDGEQARHYQEKIEHDRLASELQATGIDVDWELFDHVLTRQEIIPELLRTHRRQFASVNHPTLDAIFRHPRPATRDAILLVCADHRYFVTPMQKFLGTVSIPGHWIIETIQAYPVASAIAGIIALFVLAIVVNVVFLALFSIMFLATYLIAAFTVPPNYAPPAGNRPPDPPASSP
jgi:primosomal replication protein N''